jgi:hypothetical protein
MENRPGSVKKRFELTERIAAVGAIRSGIRENSADRQQIRPE